MPVTIESAEANAPAPTPTPATSGGGLMSAVNIPNLISGGVTGLVTQGISALGNAIFGKSQAEKDAEQLKQQGALDQQKLGYDEQFSEFGENQQQKLWNGTNSLALANEAQQEGYNPALIYGGGGGGGSTGTGGTPEAAAATASDSASQSQATAAEENAATSATATAQQGKLINAQIPQTEAGTKLEIAQTGNVEIDTKTKQLNNEYQTIQNHIAQATNLDQIQMVVQTLHNMVTQGQTILSQGMLNDANRFTIDQIRPSVVAQQQELKKQIISQTILNQAGAKLDIATARNLAEKMVLGYRELEVQAHGQQVSIENTNTMADTIIKSAGINAAAGVVGGIVKGVMAE